MKHLIFAGTHIQAMNYAREQDFRIADWVLVDRPEKLMGLEGPVRNPKSKLVFVKVGTYHEHRNAVEILETAHACGF